MTCLSLVGEEFECDITNVAHGGVFVARHDGRVVFVSGAIDGERVRVRVYDEGRNRFWRADTIEVLTPSSHRRDHVWPEASLERPPADRVGGAEFGHIDLAHQRILKARVLRESFERIGRMSLAEVLARPVTVESVGDDDAVNGLRWRTRARLHVDDSGRVGPYAERSKRVISVSKLPLVVASIERLAPLDTAQPGRESLSFVAPDAGLAQHINPGHVRPIREHVGTRAFRLNDTSFWQVHRFAPHTLWNAVTEATDVALLDPQAANLDLYGGVGLFAATLATRGGATTRITSVESDEVAVDFASENLAEWVGARAVPARVDRFLGQLVDGATATERSRLRRGTVVLDPPRSGAGGDVITRLVDLAPQQIIYVACDPVALARDAAQLVSSGYVLVHLRAFDLFPHTHHMEAVARFVRA